MSFRSLVLVISIAAIPSCKTRPVRPDVEAPLPNPADSEPKEVITHSDSDSDAEPAKDTQAPTAEFESGNEKSSASPMTPPALGPIEASHSGTGTGSGGQADNSLVPQEKFNISCAVQLLESQKKPGGETIKRAAQSNFTVDRQEIASALEEFGGTSTSTEDLTWSNISASQEKPIHLQGHSISLKVARDSASNTYVTTLWLVEWLPQEEGDPIKQASIASKPFEAKAIESEVKLSSNLAKDGELVLTMKASCTTKML